MALRMMFSFKMGKFQAYLNIIGRESTEQNRKLSKRRVTGGVSGDGGKVRADMGDGRPWPQCGVKK